MRIPTILIAALAAAGAASAQTTQGAPASDAPVLSGATLAPDCGNLPALTGRAFCVSAPLSAMESVMDAYVAHFEARGWLAADGHARRVVFIKRREGGGCDGLQMAAFQNTAEPAGAESLGYLGFSTIPGDVCASQDPQ